MQNSGMIKWNTDDTDALKHRFAQIFKNKYLKWDTENADASQHRFAWIF
jgi:hypothetical protein